MRGKNTLFPVAVILLVLGSPVFAYRQVIDLGTLGGTQSSALSINDKGQIVGWAYDNSGNQHACLFDSTGNGNNIYLGTLSGLPNSIALSINNSGQIVGTAESSTRLSSLACFFDSTGGGANVGLPSLGLVSIGPFGTACSINNNGIIVGLTRDKNNCTDAVIFDKTGGGANIDLAYHIPYQPYASYAYSINDAGKIVGGATTFPGYTGHYEVTHACIFDETGGGNNIDLAKLNVNGSEAECINNNDQIVGYALDNSIYKNENAYLFDSTGGGANIFLGTLGGESSNATFINDKGQIVGWSEVPDQVFPHACLFDPTGQGNNIDLNTLIDPSSGWTLQYAYCINDSGWIVGCGAYDGYERAFLLTPEPVTLLLFGLGVSLLRRKK